MPLVHSLEGRVAVVTGGTSGIGRATAELLSKADATVGIIGLNDAVGMEIARGIGSKAAYYHCDIGSAAEIDQTYRQLVEDYHAIDFLVHSAVTTEPGDILEIAQASIDRMEAVNVRGPLHLTRLVMSGMKQRKSGGCITFVSSTQAQVIDGAPSMYNINKATILGITTALAVAGGPYNIRVNAVSPGLIITEGMGNALKIGKDYLIASNERTPLGRPGIPQEVAREIVNLCFATYTTGDNRIVDGGRCRVALPDEQSSGA